jgi:uncharacterized membrane protein YheB (UPF0754 family)
MIYIIPLVTAAIGWLIHRGFINYVIKTVIPSQQDTIARQAGTMAAAQLNLAKISEQIADGNQLKALKPYIEQHINVFLNEKLKEKFPMIAMFAGEKTMDKIKEGLMEEIDHLLPQILGKISNNLSATLDIEQMVSDKIVKMEKSVFASKVKGILDPFFSKLVMVGILSGFVSGVVALAIALLLN